MRRMPGWSKPSPRSLRRSGIKSFSGRHPGRCPVAPESCKFAEEIRELVYGKRRHKHKYRILFTIRENMVAILYVYHSSRKELEP